MKKPLLIALVLLAFIGKTKAQMTDLPDTIKAVTKSDTTVFSVVENLPVFPGGENKLNKYIKKSLEYNIGYGKGGARVSFVVEKNGSLSRIKVVKNTSSIADTDIVKTLSDCPTKWIPGSQNGKPVRVFYSEVFYFEDN